MYLYTHPLFTSILLVAIGLTFGVCFTLLMLEVFYVGFNVVESSLVQSFV